MPLEFKPICLADQARYRELFAACPAPTSDYTFANLWGWREHYLLEWAFADGLAWIRQTLPEPAVWSPIGDWAGKDWAACSCLSGMSLVRVPAPLVARLEEALPGRITATPARDHFDYVYGVSDLVELRGNKFHKKKNLLSQFRKNYAFEYQPMTTECVESVLDLQENWCRWNECESEALVAENVAIHKVLTSFDRIEGLTGGSLWVDGKIVAYTVAEVMTPDMLVIHFEKGDIHYKGVYQAINQMFLANQAGTATRVNREQDLGDEGLRQAKLSYNPTGFLEKYEVTVAA
jgi:hypothetical protein